MRYENYPIQGSRLLVNPFTAENKKSVRKKGKKKKKKKIKLFYFE